MRQDYAPPFVKVEGKRKVLWKREIGGCATRLAGNIPAKLEAPGELCCARALESLMQADIASSFSLSGEWERGKGKVVDESEQLTQFICSSF
jgi:hypothetical protein